jgi:hypothetical protein
MQGEARRGTPALSQLCGPGQAHLPPFEALPNRTTASLAYMIVCVVLGTEPAPATLVGLINSCSLKAYDSGLEVMLKPETA